MSDAVSIVELGPRDGLQNEAVALDVATRAAFVRALAAAGLRRIEAGAFVRPDRVPQMAGSDQLCSTLTADAALLGAGVRLSALVPNLKGLERAVAAGVREVAVFPAASETFSRRNLNQGVDEALASAAEVCAAATRQGLAVRGYVSTAFGCPYEGPVPVAAVIRVCEHLLAAGVHEVAVSDTIGVAHPGQVRDVLSAMLTAVPRERLALHFHDTRGTALANVIVGLEMGIRTFDASVGGLGGCPYAPGAAGNLATEDLVYMLHGMGIGTGIDLDKLVEAGRVASAVVGRELPGKVLKAGVRSLRG